ncbi:type I DNA topoisomerase [Desulfonatronovibrio hydrogenovorans]|uniref:type I DNA topoisomerase n=1 Tax=Desulfonatronovibrio hydrogenovorans TaxID=53245 RepID=UPI00048C8348|nr:type I DNA topoisomerase [Desulfonatronovibrio hydrogenovorans]
MSKDLIIVESPAKVKTIKKFLGKDYLVEASVGHIRDLPKKTLGVSEDGDFEPEYEIIYGKKKVVNQLQQSAKKSERVFLAPDPDREGEAIAWHIAQLIKKQNTNIKRIQFNEITSRAVKEALDHPRDLNENLFNSQQARRILDRLVGYKISPLLWNKVKRGLSAGRVQSVALRMIVERERERQAFIPEEYWVFKAMLAPDKAEAFESHLWKVDNKKARVGSEKEAMALDAVLQKSRFKVEAVEEKERKRDPKPPFITSTLQQEASNRMGFTAKRTMSVAQRLYEGVDLGDRGTTALITYMRTDSVRVSKDSQKAAKKWILSSLGKDYYPAKTRFFKSKGSAQDAHEAVRPVDPGITPEEIRSYLPRDEYMLYKLVWERFMASQMAPARFWDTTVTVSAANTLWRSKGERLIFDGFLKVYSGGSAKEDIFLPKLEPDQALDLKSLSKEQKFTQPPARYSEASLVRKLEELGIGRPSTYAAIISTLLDREYVSLEEKNFRPTELGSEVCDLLVKHFPSLLDAGFTAQMEEDLDTVAEGRKDWVELLKQFTGGFYPTLEKAKKEMATVKAGKETDIKCEKCGQIMLIRFGRNGAFLACSAYPDCKSTANFTRDDSGKIKVLEAEPVIREKVGTCPDCQGDLVLKKARTGSRFIACDNYPQCKYTAPFSTDIPCPVEDCPGEMVEKGSRRGKVFYGCNQYPKCDYAVWNYPVQEECPKCGHKILVRKSTKTRGEHVACPEKTCKFWDKLEEE